MASNNYSKDSIFRVRYRRDAGPYMNRFFDTVDQRNSFLDSASMDDITDIRLGIYDLVSEVNLADETKDTKPRILHLHLKFKWYDLIESGEKTDELRLATDRWRDRLEGKTYDEIHLYRAYPSKAEYPKARMKRRWTGAVKKIITHEEFGTEPVEVFSIDVSQPL